MKRKISNSFLANLFTVGAVKESLTRTVSTFLKVGSAVYSPQNYETYSRIGYQKNALVFSCISKITTAASGVEWLLYKKQGTKYVEVYDHPILNLIKKPNPLQTWTAFTESWLGFYLLSGNSFIELNGPSDNLPPTELWPVRPDRMSIIVGKKGYPLGYKYSDNGFSKIFEVDQINFKSKMLHAKTFNPTDMWWGQSFLQAGISALDQNNKSNEWNLSMLQNAASPSGIFTIDVTPQNPKGELSDEKFARLKSEIDTMYAGAKNAGRPMLGEGGLKWQQMSLSPKDMDFFNNRNVSAEDICRIYGVPAEILGLGQKTFSNYKEANYAFYTSTVIPLLKLFRSHLNEKIVSLYGDDSFYLDFNEDDIEPIQTHRMDQYSTLQSVNYLTVNEKRNKVKYESVEGGDVFIIGTEAVKRPDEIGFSSFGGDDDITPDVNQPRLTTEQARGIMDIMQSLYDGKIDLGGAIALAKLTYGLTDEEASSIIKEPVVKKPNETIPDEDEEELSDEDKEMSFNSFKTFNPLNQNEMQQSRRQQAARKKRLEIGYAKSLNGAFLELSKSLQKITSEIKDKNLLMIALTREIYSDDNKERFSSIISKNSRQVAEEFGFVIFNEAKCAFPKSFEMKETNRKFDDFLTAFIARRTGEAIKTITDTNEKQMRRIVKRLTEENLIEGDSNPLLAKELFNEFESLSKGRSRVIARTETAIASNNASREAVKSINLPNMEKGWVSQLVGDRRDGGKNGDGPNHQIMNGQWVPLDEKFAVPPDADMDGPGDEHAEVGQLANCTCAMVYRSRN